VSETIGLNSVVIVRNTRVNFIAQIIPLLVAVVAIPPTVQGLGAERFGLISMAWVMTGYLAIFDLGLGRATTKFVAEFISKGMSEEIPCIVWTAATVQLILGIIGGLVLVVITPILVEQILNIPEWLVNEAQTMLYLLASSVPVILLSGSFRGVLEALQRFDLMNAVQIPGASLTYLLPLIGLCLKLGVPGIVLLLLLGRFVILISFIALDMRLIPDLKVFSPSLRLFPRLFSYGAWIMVTMIVNPILIYLDRILIASLLSLEMLTYYSIPYEALIRLQIIPASLTMTLFPAFSALEARGDRQRLATFFARSMKYILLIFGLFNVLVALFGTEVMRLWLGTGFMRESGQILRILAIGVGINCAAYIPSSLLSGAGRPDVPAKLHLVELPVYVVIAYFFIRHWGVTGAAWAWTFRVTLDALLLLCAALKIYRFSFDSLVVNGTALSAFLALILVSLAYVLKAFLQFWQDAIGIAFSICIVGLFCWLSWKRILDGADKKLLLQFLRIGGK
jgi:O-antigen/teichoic acid export membrane protein